MIYALSRRFFALNRWVKIIWLFCLLGAIIDLVCVINDLRQGGVLLRLHVGFLILYVGQVVFILCRERWVAVLSLLQAVMAFLTNLDFTFVPALRLIGEAIYLVHGEFSVRGLEVYKYVFVSAVFTLEILKTYFLWSLLRTKVSDK